MTEPRALRLLVVLPVEEHHLNQIRQVAPEAEVEQTTDRARVVDLAPEVDVIVGWNVSREAVQRAGRLRWIHSTAAGVDQLLHPEILERDIILTTSSGIHAESITEHVLALMLAFARRLHVAIRNQLAHRWDRPSTVGRELRGKTVGILGLGHIGREVAARAAAFGMRVIGTKHTPEPIPHADRVLPPEGLDEVLREADYLVITLPLTSGTRGLIGPRELGLMKSSAYLINVARGAIVQEAALIEALRQGRLAGAGLDVFEREPLPQDSPLYEMEQVILTPHVSGGGGTGYYDLAIPLFCENLRRYLTGEPLVNVVDKRRGY
jgi:phosphoglycerate dehydrogenase-like enzyme